MTNRTSDIVSRAEARLGTVLRGKYRLDRVLGAGGMAVVYKATHRNQAQFAVKMLHPELSINADVCARFLREGYAANSVKHPGAVLVVDDDVAEDGAAFLVMELLDGVGCEDAWERSGRRLSPEAASAILIQLLDVLGAAHANGIVHRDIKPANLFLTRNGVVKVLDFGIARAREAMANSGQTGTGMTLGTPAFMAPEQALGRSREIDGRTDLWAVGATFLSLVSGEFVHPAESAQELVVKAATQPARSLSSVAPQVPSALAAVIDRALAFKREDRWETAAAMRDALLGEHALGTATPEAIVASLVPGSNRPTLPLKHTMQSADPRQPTALDHAQRGRPGPTVALTTSAPMWSDPEGPLVVPSRRWAVWTGVVAVVAIASGTYFVRLPRSSVVGQGATASQDPVLQPLAPSGVAAGATAPTLAAPATSVPDASGISDAAAPAVSSAEHKGSVAQPPQYSKRPPTNLKKKDPKEGATPTSPDCALNYTLDDQGQKHFKPECFLNK